MHRVKGDGDILGVEETVSSAHSVVRETKLTHLKTS